MSKAHNKITKTKKHYLAWSTKEDVKQKVKADFFHTKK